MMYPHSIIMIVILFAAEIFGQLCPTSDNVIKCEKQPKIVVSEYRRHNHNRQKRTGSIVFPINSAMGIIVAIAVPLDIPKRNVFMSYNVEGNYNHATSITDVVPGPLLRLQLVNRGFKNAGDSQNYEMVSIGNDTQIPVGAENSTATDEVVETTTSKEWVSEDDDDDVIVDNSGVERREIRGSLMNRLKLYKILDNKFTSAGFNGTICLLRAICQSAESPINPHNGVLGDIFHIILTPSSSKYEKISPEFYEAEKLGRKKQCNQFTKYCPQSIFDIITTITDH